MAGNVVQPFFSAAPNWNQYVVNDAPDWLSSSNQPCTRTIAAAQKSNAKCLHGGEMRAVPVPGRASCAGLRADDALAAFDWTCVVRGGVATMVSTKLKESVRMAALLDFTAGAWRRNSVTVSDGSGGLLTTPMELWWTNPVVIDSNGLDVDSNNTIYLVAADVTQPYFIRGDGNALVVQPGRSIGPVTSGRAVRLEGSAAQTGNALAFWFEGATRSVPPQLGSSFRGLFGVVRHVSHSGAASALTANPPLDFNEFHNGRVEHVRVHCGGGSQTGFALNFDSVSSGVLLRDARSATCSSLTSGLRRGVMEGLASFSDQSPLLIGRNTMAADVTAAHHHNGGASTGIQVGIGDVLMHATAANNAVGGIIVGDWGSMVIGFASTQNRRYGLSMPGRTFHRTEDPVVIVDGAVWSNTHWGVAFALNDGPWPHVFRGIFRTGQNGRNPPTNYYMGQACIEQLITTPGDCYGSRTTLSGSPTGLRTTATAPYTCIVDTNSTAQLIQVGGMGGFFRTRATDDPVNASDDVDGLAPYATLTDWNSFSRPHMGWGAQGSGTPHCLAQEACDAMATGSVGCQIYDYSLRTSVDQVLIGSPLSRPTGNDVHTMDFELGLFLGMSAAECTATFASAVVVAPDATHPAGVCRVTFLARAREVLRDFVGNDNLLCESGETCLFTPNLASYQGHGAVIPSPGFTFANGTISNVALVEYEFNGYADPFRP